MSDDWLTSEPEVGQFAWVDTPKEIRIARCVKLDGKTVWDLGDNKFWPIDAEWKPITTPEELRLRAEVERLREDARWRKWPDEVPTETGYYTIYLGHMKYPVTSWFSVNSGWDVNHKRFWWIKLEMPKTEAGGESFER